MKNEQNTILKIAQIVRQILLNEFPEHHDLRFQCKRASILLSLAFKKIGFKHFVFAGYISKENDPLVRERGHVWIVMPLGKTKHILDVTLTQFQEYLGMKIPDIVFGEEKTIREQYHYVYDGLGTYQYHRDDVRKNLVERLFQELQML